MAVKTVIRTFLLVNVALMASAAVLPRAGTQFITGACASDNDCATSCCGFKSGKCAAAVVAQERDGGCGFGDIAPNNLATLALGSKEAAAGVDNSKAGQRAAGGAVAAAPAAPANAAAAPAAPAAGAARTPGTQFITGACSADTDCATLCCGFKSGKCAAAVVAQERDGGCGFGDVSPNNLATLALGSSAAAAGVDNSKAGQRAAGSAAAPAAPAAPDAGAAAAPAAPATGSGKAPGTQFITGECANDGECASTCCSVGKCAARLVATGPGGKGCGFGGADASPAAAAPAAPAAPAAGSGKAAGTQFITGACANDGECASTCCSVGKCAARLVATGPGGKGCGFGGAAARRMTRSMKMNRLD